MRIGMTAMIVALAGGFVFSTADAKAQDASSRVKVAQAVPPQESSPRVRRSPARLRIYPYYQQEDVYPRYDPGPNAVRVCNATYVQEFRPSGTVIVPRMSCYWTRG
jgi:hypothetical protein